MNYKSKKNSDQKFEADYDVVILIDHYLPGIKSGGPVTSITNMIHALDDLKFLILTRNFDLDGSLYNLPINQIVRVGKADVVYLNEELFIYDYLERIIKSSGAKLFYINSFFSVSTVEFFLKWFFKRRADLKIILAPRGQFSSGALAINRTKKRLYLFLFRTLHFERGIAFQATSDIEKTDIEKVLGDVTVFTAPNIPTTSIQNEWSPIRSKKVVFLSRISLKKNLIYALKILEDVDFPVTFDIYGFMEDEHYWKRCLAVISNLPKNIRVNYLGPLNHEKITETLSNYNLFLFPTFGENYGHVIYEALSAGCPVLITENTPWHDVETAGVGRIIPLSFKDEYIKAIKYYTDLGDEAREKISQMCYDYAINRSQTDEGKELTRNMFIKIR